jgi:hypothetical protein
MMRFFFRAMGKSDVDVFTIHEPPRPPLDRIDRAASLMFVRDGFSWPAALFSPVWLAVKGLWFAFVAYFGVVLVASAVLWSFDLLESWFGWLVIGLNIYLGFEASTLERMWLSYRGWTEVGTVTGRNLPECERRFFETWLAATPEIETALMPGVPAREPGLLDLALRRIFAGPA